MRARVCVDGTDDGGGGGGEEHRLKELPPDELKDFERKARREAKARKAVRREEVGVRITVAGGASPVNASPVAQSPPPALDLDQSLD